MSDDYALQTSSTFRALADSLPLSVLIKASDGRRVFANKAYLTWRNLRWEDVEGKTDAELFPEEIASQYAADDAEILQSGNSCHHVESTRRADGKEGWLECVKSPIRDDDGNGIGIQVLFWDVTDRVETEKAMRFEQSLLKTLLDNIPDSIYFKDKDSRFIRVSSALARKFGLQDVDQVHGRSDADIFSAQHAEEARQDELQVIQTGTPLVDRVEKETWVDRDDTWCLTTKMPLRNEDDEVIGTFGISRDITQLKQSEAALKEAVRMADAANRAKSDFLANMSHEIRTPLNAMVGMGDLLAQTKLDEDQKDCVDTIRQSSDTLLRLINDILDFSKIEARRMELDCVVFSLPYEAQAALSTLRLQANEKSLELQFEMSSDLPSTYRGDPGRLRQILVNLIGNAVKFTDQGVVRVGIESIPEGQFALRDQPVQENQSASDSRSAAENQPASEETGSPLRTPDDLDSTTAGAPPTSKRRLRISVSDTGIGIPEDQHSAILDPFTQADASTTRRFGGTGLGLSITRQLVELFGGELKLESRVGVGTVFSFEIELDVAAEKILKVVEDDDEDDLGAGSSVRTEPLRVLVAEDGVTNQHVISGLLRSLGHECSIASDGRETLAKWKTESFDLILMDMHMPVMDGLEATRAIREDEMEREVEQGTRLRIPIIALTAAAMAEDAIACRRAGMDAYLTKPIRRRKLEETLAQYLREAALPDEELTTYGELSDSPTVVDHRPRAASQPRRHSAASIVTMMDDSSDSLHLSAVHAGCLDLDSARSRIPGGASGVIRLATVFRGECKQLLDQLTEQLPAGDNRESRRTAHTLKGACGLLGAKHLQAIAEEIESAGREERLSDSEESSRLLKSLEVEARRVLAAIEELLS